MASNEDYNLENTINNFVSNSKNEDSINSNSNNLISENFDEDLYVRNRHKERLEGD